MSASIQEKPSGRQSSSWSAGSAPVLRVEVAHPPLQALMPRIFEQVPVEAGVVGPFLPLAEFVTHEHELLARQGEHVAVKNPQVGALFRVVSPASWPGAIASPAWTSSCERGKR